MAIRKIELMHRQFEKLPGHKCAACSNLIEVRVHDMQLRKCKVYGITSSAASDWAQKYEACGMFDKPWDKGPIIRLVKPENAKDIEDEPLEGQVSFFEGE